MWPHQLMLVAHPVTMSHLFILSPASGDYNASVQTVTFEPGVTSMVVEISTSPDTILHH